jgi:hypothetical protein
MDWNELKTGAKVHYDPGYKIPENGIIKSMDEENAFVVYHCAGDWDNYRKYTGARTPLSKLKFGWVDEKGKLLKEFCDHHYTPSANKWEPINRRTCQWCGDTID